MGQQWRNPAWTYDFYRHLGHVLKDDSIYLSDINGGITTVAALPRPDSFLSFLLAWNVCAPQAS